ncbi:Hydroxyacid oxidase 1 [Dipsacomyces acuminosporus]|nr:Hydroxyacid oxidase 1 [Dipsacomyces acuminosporus]
MENDTTVPVCVNDLEKLARDLMPAAAWGYYDSGANDEQTKFDNVRAFDNYRLHPRILRDVSKIDTSTTILGQKMRTPLGIAPCAMHKLAHSAGEIATSKAASAHGTVMILSTYSTTPLEQVIAQGNKDTQYWMQLYAYKEHHISETLVRRAEKAGFKALVLTVDTPALGRRLVDVRNKFNPLPYLKFENVEQPQDMNNPNGSVGGMSPEDLKSASALFSASVDQSLTWEHTISWLKSITKMPIIVKGILTAEDTMLAIEHGCAGVIVSNHGGRQLDGTLAAIDALPQVAEAAEGKIEVYMDGGIRKGTDIFKALALGARAVFVARPVLWGLAHKGEEGVNLSLDLLEDEFELTMQLAGTRTIAEIDDTYVYEPERRWVRCSVAREARKMSPQASL